MLILEVYREEALSFRWARQNGYRLPWDVVGYLEIRSGRQAVGDLYRRDDLAIMYTFPSKQCHECSPANG